jgi:hypothetical protein
MRCTVFSGGFRTAPPIGLEPSQYAAWLDAPCGASMDFKRPFPPDMLTATATATATAPIEGTLF